MGRIENWRARGPAISDAELRERLADVLVSAGRLLPPEGGPAAVPRGVDESLSQLDGLIELATEMPRTDPERGDLLAALHQVHGDLREYRLRRRYDALGRMQKTLARLRGISSTEEMVERAPGEIARGLGFDRVILSRVEDSLWIPVKIHVEGDDGWAEEILKAASFAPQPLDHMILESEMARRRAPMLVFDVQESRQVHRPIAEVSDSRSYVAAPIMPEGNVIGFFHADYYVTQRHPDEIDRDVLFAFAEAFGYVFERVVLAGRIRAQGAQVSAMAASLEAVLGEIRDSEVRIAGDSEPTADGQPRLAPPAPGDHRLHTLLTARELEVLALLAAGHTNAGIGERLVISEGTVKSHVKHILRKLRASNRAEAVSKYLRLTQRAGLEV
ncbi:helix-turn-helix transcriptional regulator [Paraconexibacter antarcticus]|uniref:helix-turn-helix transcriptional regulator n=1 Tax=Paraconexibacter antarcticus TaxID=2949664 RepID=UPI0026668FBE|nr:LuxR C-terminal-related transcriptional regulator [Paraconexibacter antarcticus]